MRQNQKEMTVKIMVNKLANLLPVRGARNAGYKNLKWAIPEKYWNRGGGGSLLARYLLAINQ